MNQYEDVEHSAYQYYCNYRLAEAQKHLPMTVPVVMIKTSSGSDVRPQIQCSTRYICTDRCETARPAPRCHVYTWISKVANMSGAVRGLAADEEDMLPLEHGADILVGIWQGLLYWRHQQ